jgi:transposase
MLYYVYVFEKHGGFKASSCVCCECGQRHDLKLSDRWLSCPCGNEIDRDYNTEITR